MSPLLLALALATTPPRPPTPPEPPQPGALPALPGTLVGSWPASGRTVKLEDDVQLDDAVTEITRAADWDLVLDTGRAGREEVHAALSDLPAEEALRLVLAGSPFAARRAGNVVTVAPPGEARIRGLSGTHGKRISIDDDDSVDETLSLIGKAAGWNVVLHTGRAGDALLRVRLREVPVESALEAVLWGTSLTATVSGNALVVTTAEALPPPSGEVLEGFDTRTGKLFSGDFENTPADQAIRKILDAAGLSVVLPRNAKEPVTGHFKDAAVEDALRAVCAEAGLSAVRRGTVVTIQSGGPTSGADLQLSGIDRVVQGALARAGIDDDDAREAQREAERDADEARREGEEAAREAREEARQEAAEARKEAREAEEEARQARDEAAEDADPDRAGKDRIVTGNVTLGPGEHVRDLVALHGNAQLGPGARAREVTAVAGNVEVGPGAIVEKDVTAFGGNVHVAPGARVKHEATSVGGKVIIDPGAIVHGQPVRMSLPPLPGLPGLPEPPQVREAHSAPLLRAGLVILEFGLYFTIGLVLMMVWPRRLERVLLALEKTPARSTAVGLLGLVAAVPLVLLSCVAILILIGLVLVPLEALLLVVATMLGYSALALLIGRKLPPRWKLTPVGQLALGTAAITLVTHIPKLGGVIGALAWIVVFGAVLSTRFGQSDAGEGPAFPLADAVESAVSDAR